MVSNKFILSFIVLLIIIPLALATTIEPAKSNGRYSLGDSVSFKGTCVKAGNTVAIEAGIGLNRVWVGEETANANKVFQTTNFVPPQKGTYSVTAACDTESSATSRFCVGSSAECGTTTITTTSSSTGSSTGGSSGGGGGGGCIPKWETGYSLCNSSLQRTKTSVDVSTCKRKTRVNVESCLKCEESWVCSGSNGAAWGACINGQQTRTCADEHLCGTTTQKPALTRSCVGESTFTPPTLPPSRPPAFDHFEPVDSGNDVYLAWLIGGVASLLILLIVILITFIMSKHHHIIYNHDELVEWIQKERSMGTTDQDIKEILADNTGWTYEELEDAFSMLQSVPAQ